MLPLRVELPVLRVAVDELLLVRPELIEELVVVLGVRATLLLVLRLELPVLRVTVDELVLLVPRVLVAVLVLLVPRVVVAVLVPRVLVVPGVRATLLLVLRVTVPRVAVAEPALRVDVAVVPRVALAALVLRVPDTEERLLGATDAERTDALARTLCVLRISRAFTMPAFRRSNERSGCATA